jgi:hypothetical protein
MNHVRKLKDSSTCSSIVVVTYVQDFPLYAVINKVGKYHVLGNLHARGKVASILPSLQAKTLSSFSKYISES